VAPMRDRSTVNVITQAAHSTGAPAQQLSYDGRGRVSRKVMVGTCDWYNSSSSLLWDVSIIAGEPKTVTSVLMIVGALGIGYGFLSAPKSTQEVEQILEKEQQEAHHAHAGHNDHQLSQEEHDAHVAHIYHQEANKPWSALYVAGIFFFLMAVGVLAFYAIQHASQAGWSPVVFRVMEGITAYVPIGAVIMFLLLLASALHYNHLFVWMDEDVVANDVIIQGKTGYLNIPFFLIRAVI